MRSELPAKGCSESKGNLHKETQDSPSFLKHPGFFCLLLLLLVLSPPQFPGLQSSYLAVSSSSPSPELYLTVSSSFQPQHHSLFPSLWFLYPKQNLSLKYPPTFQSDHSTLSEYSQTFLFATSSILHFLVLFQRPCSSIPPPKPQLTHTCTCTEHDEIIPYILHVAPLPQFGLLLLE